MRLNPSNVGPYTVDLGFSLVNSVVVVFTHTLKISNMQPNLENSLNPLRNSVKFLGLHFVRRRKGTQHMFQLICN